MKFRREKVFRTVTEDDQNIFDEKCNEVLKGMEDAQYHFNEIPGKFSVTIIGQKTITICESISEEYAERGERHYCCECKFFQLPKDKRIKYVNCGHCSGLASAQAPACDFFYEMLEDGADIFKH